jgi:hypothetical protein
MEEPKIHYGVDCHACIRNGRCHRQFQSAIENKLLAPFPSGTPVMPGDMDSFSIRGITTWQRGGFTEFGLPYDPGAAFRIAVEDYKQDVQNDPK